MVWQFGHPPTQHPNSGLTGSEELPALTAATQAPAMATRQQARGVVGGALFRATRLDGWMVIFHGMYMGYKWGYY